MPDQVNNIEHNAHILEKELEWLRQVIDTRLKLFWKKECPYQSIYELEPPAFESLNASYASFITDNKLNIYERLLLILALAPHIKPEVLDAFLIKNGTYNKKFTEFGGFQLNEHTGFQPTCQTALFLLSENKLQYRFLLQSLFEPFHPFVKGNIISLEKMDKKGTHWNSLLTVSREYIDYFTIGELRKPDFNAEFPAKRISTSLEWDDLILKQHTRKQLNEIKEWLDYGHILYNGWGLSDRIKPGYKSLFYGPSGTGKTLAASLLGKLTGKDVYRVDLSQVVSKYIGETEKNLANIFDKGECRDWILFFDEADALFGKRGETKSAHDRYANQEVAYLLQRIEDYAGLVILASNLKENIDAAFTRRFQSIIHFSAPESEERHQLWQKAFSKKSVLEEKIDLKKIAEKHNISGALIMNAVQYASIKSLTRNSNVITLSDLEGGIRKELEKEGITLT